MGVVQLALPTEDKISYSYRILVVDDNEACAKTMMWMMEVLATRLRLRWMGIQRSIWRRPFCPT